MKDMFGFKLDAGLYWLSPESLLERVRFHLGVDYFDACPHPRPADFDGLHVPWLRPTYVNPPFGPGLCNWARKVLQESLLVPVAFVFPANRSSVLEILFRRNPSCIENLGPIKWLDVETGLPSKGRHQCCLMFVYRPYANITG